MDSDLKPPEELIIDKELAVNDIESKHVLIELNDNSEDIVMNFDSTEDQIKDQNTEELVITKDVESNSLANALSVEEISSTPIKEEAKVDDVLEHEDVLANDVMNLDVNEEFIVRNEEDNQESQIVTESQNTPLIDSERLSAEEGMTLDNPVIRNESTCEDVSEETNAATIPPTGVDEDMSDSDLRIAGLKTSLLLSEDKVRELEVELKTVYQHLFKCLEEKKSLQKKCDTLGEQLEKMMATSAQKRPAQESPGSTVKQTPPKKTPNLKQTAEQNNNSNNRKSVRFQEQRPFFGRFGARYQEDRGFQDVMTPPPYPGRFAAAFQPPPMVMASRAAPSPVGPYRGAPVMTSPEMTDIALNDGFQLISNIGNRLHLTATIVDRAIRLFRQCYESPLRAMCRTQNQSTATACVYIACREEHCPQTFKTLCSVSKIDFKVMSQCCKYIVNAFGLCLDQMTPDEAIVEFCARSGLLPHVQRAANQIARKALQMNLLSVKSPLTAAAAAIFMASMASDDQRPVFEIAVLTGVGDTTIRNTYNRMVSYARQLFPPNFPFFVPPEQLPRV